MRPNSSWDSSTQAHSRLLVTSRRASWDPTLRVQALPLGVLSREESRALLRKFRPDLAQSEADAVAQELGDLPLALHLAGNFLARYRRAVTPAAYLAQLRNPKLLEHPSLAEGGLSPTDHVQHVARTFALSYQRLDPDDPTDALALALLARAARFAPGLPIPCLRLPPAQAPLMISRLSLAPRLP